MVGQNRFAPCIELLMVLGIVLPLLMLGIGLLGSSSGDSKTGDGDQFESDCDPGESRFCT